jgi:2-alkyl-3-oxoalkanoate reductase
MRVFLAGASGTLGQSLVPQLVEAGHHVIGSTRTPGKAAVLESRGAEPVVMDGLDADSVMEAVTSTKPDVVIHQMTALTELGNLKRFDREFDATNRLRTTGTDHLIAAAREAGAKRLIVQSYTGWPNERTGSMVKDEDAPLDAHPPKESTQTLAAIRYVEELVPALPDLEGLVLRYGGFYGPGNEMLDMVRKRKLPVVGGGAGVWSFVHLDDAAAATVRAVTEGAPGLYNICDDEPAPVSQWLPYLAASLGAKKPMRLPAWLARPLIGNHGISLMTQVRGSSNARAKADLGWELRYPSWRDGFRSGL